MHITPVEGQTNHLCERLVVIVTQKYGREDNGEIVPKVRDGWSCSTLFSGNDVVSPFIGLAVCANRCFYRSAKESLRFASKKLGRDREREVLRVELSD